eukprot:763491-Hanusia_phi.AAC.3
MREEFERRQNLLEAQFEDVQKQMKQQEEVLYAEIEKKQTRIEELESNLKIQAGQSNTTESRIALLEKDLHESKHQIEMKEKEVLHLQQCLNKAEQELVESQDKLQDHSALMEQGNKLAKSESTIVELNKKLTGLLTNFILNLPCCPELEQEHAELQAKHDGFVSNSTRQAVSLKEAESALKEALERCKLEVPAHEAVAEFNCQPRLIAKFPWSSRSRA